MFSDVTTVVPLVRSDINFVRDAHVRFYLFKEVKLLHFLHGNLPASLNVL